MSFITNILLKSIIQKETLHRKKQFLNWYKIEKVAIVLDNSIPLNKSVIDKFCADSKKFIEIYYIELSSKQPTYGDWQCFTRNQKTVFKLPKQTILENLKKREFDCVINTCSETNLFSIAVVSSMQSLLKCGNNNEYHQSDLIILKSHSFNLIDYLNDVIRYLKMIK